jgi:hypothetical protein
MSRKLKIIIGVVAAVVLLTLAGTSVAIAQTPPPTPPAVSNALLTRVAQILNIPEAQLVDAFKQAEKELRTQAIDQALQNAVQNGRLTQQQAKDIKDWWDKRPAVVDSVLPRFFGVIPGMRGMMGGVWNVPTGSNAVLSRVGQILGITQDKLVNAIRQAQQELSQQRPNLPRVPRGYMRGWGGMGGWCWPGQPQPTQ